MSNRHSRFPKAHFLKSILLSNIKRLSFPFKLAYAVTYRCNLKCKMCNIWRKSLNDNELNIKEIDGFFKRGNKFSWVGITGGEPFLRTDLPEIIDIIITYCKRLTALHFATNGQLMDKIIDLTHYIHKKNKKLKIVYNLSIDGPPSLHDEIRGAQGVWKKTINTFKCLKDIESVKAQIGYTISPYNIDRFEETFMSLKGVCPDIEFDDITVNIFQKSDFYYENQDIQDLDYDKLENEIRKILRMDNDRFSINNFLRRTYLKLYLKYIKTKKCPLKCQALSSSCFLDPYGDLFPCSVYNKKLLNIKNTKENFSKIWNTDYAKRLSYECSNYICPSCWSPCDANCAIAGSLKRAWFER